jgi:signal peptidase II
MGANSHFLFKKIFFIALPLVACLGLMYLIWKTKDKSFQLGLAYSLILSGAIGNLIDRIYYSYVVDFFDFYIKNAHFATFNIADAAISIAAFILILDFFQDLKLKDKLKT